MPDEIQRFETGARMSQAVVAGGFVFVAGQVATSTGAPVAQQTIEILDRIERLLADAGTDKSRLVAANVWLTDSKHFADFNQVWDAWIPAGHAPTRACVASGLMRTGIDVEVAVTALAEDRSPGRAGA